MTKNSILAFIVLIFVCALAGCNIKSSQTNLSNTQTPVNIISEELENSNIADENEINNTNAPIIDKNFISSKEDISINLDFNVYAYSEGIWGDGSYDCLCFYFNNFDVDYYEVKVNDRIYKVIEGPLFINEKYLNTLLDEFNISAFDWDGNLINESNYNNVMFFSPQVSSEIQDISNYKDIINHLWIVGPEYNGHGEFDAEINMEGLSGFSSLETLSLDNSIEYYNFSLDDISQLSKLHTLYLEYFINDLSFLSRLPYLRSLEIWLDESYMYSNLGSIDTLKKLEVYSNSITNLNLVSNFPNLEILDIEANTLADIQEISDLKMLNKLILARTDNLEITEILPPAELNTLIIYGVEREDYSFLKFFNNITELRIISTDILDLSFLEIYNNLTVLDLNRSYSSLHYKENLDFIKTKIRLKTLILPIDYYNYCIICNGGTNMEKENKLNDISFINELINLENLVVDAEDINNLSTIGKLENLKSLVVANIDDISWITDNLYNLYSLTLLNTSIDNFSPIENLKNLRQFHIYENYIYDSDGYIDYEYKFDYTFLKALDQLMYLRIYNFEMYYEMKDNKFPDLSDLDNLIVVDLGSLRCDDISGIFNAVNIEKIILIDCEFSGFEGIEKLERLNLLDTSWSDINAESMSLLKKLFGAELIVLEWG